MDKTCKNCKFWERPGGQSGQCTKVDGSVGDRTLVSDRLRVDIYATMLDDSGLYTELLTGPDFGCVLFQPMPWRATVVGSLHSAKLYTQYGELPSNIDEAIAAADAAYGEYGWNEVYNGDEGYLNPNIN